MEIKTDIAGDRATLAVNGRLDTVTSPELQSALAGLGDGVRHVTVDFAALEYISSAGLRVLLTAHKRSLGVNGTLTIANANAAVRDVFEMTGFSDILTLV